MRKEAIAIGILITLVGAVLVFYSRNVRSGSAPLPKPDSQVKIVADSKDQPAYRQFAPDVLPQVATETRTATNKPELSSKQLIDDLAKIAETNSPVTAEQAARFKQNLAELIRRGAASVPAIQEYLAKSVDVGYENAPGGEQLGYSSLRASLIDALNQIGGPEAQSAMAQVLQTTAAPSEILELAKDLEQSAPGKYRDQIVAGAQETLSMGATNALGTNAELGSAFRALQNYGGGGGMTDPANNNPLQFSNAVQLANMPGAQGLPSLIQMEQNPYSKVAATEMIAQLAGQNSEALLALAQLAQDGQIQQSEWLRLAPILGGDQYQFDSTGQTTTVVAGTMTPDQITRRIELIDAFLASVPQGSAAATALQQERSILNGKLGTN